MSKISVPRLRILTIYSNKIQRCDKLSRVDSNKLQEWEFDYNNVFEDYRVDLLDFMFKLKSFDRLKKIYIQDEKRICNKNKIKLIEPMVKNWKLPESYRGRFANIRLENDFGELMFD